MKQRTANGNSSQRSSNVHYQRKASTDDVPCHQECSSFLYHIQSAQWQIQLQIQNLDRMHFAAIMQHSLQTHSNQMGANNQSQLTNAVTKMMTAAKHA